MPKKEEVFWSSLPSSKTDEYAEAALLAVHTRARIYSPHHTLELVYYEQIAAHANTRVIQAATSTTTARCCVAQRRGAVVIAMANDTVIACGLYAALGAIECGVCAARRIELEQRRVNGRGCKAAATTLVITARR